MQIKNLQIFSVPIGTAANGSWIDVSNLVNLSIQVNGIEGNTWIEASNDPNAPIDGTGITAPSAAPTLSQFLSTPGNLSTQPPNPAPITSQLPAQTFYVKTTFITKWGETTASASASLAVTAGNYLYVAPAAPTAGTQAPYVTGYNVYVSLTGSAGTWVLQTGPQYQPQRLVDGVGTPGGTVNPLGPGQSTHFAISGAIPIVAPGWAMTNGFQPTEWVPPSSDNSGGAASGVKICGTTLVGATSSANINIAITGTNAMVNPSGLVWKYLRVAKDSNSTALATTAWLVGQNG